MKRLQIVIGLLCLVSVYTYSQQLSGIVYLVDKPVKGAIVNSVETGNSIKTDANGYFSLEVPVNTSIEVKYKGLNTTILNEGLDAYTDVILVPSEKQFSRMIERSPSINACQLFLSAYPQSARSVDVSQKLEELIYIKAYDEAVAQYNLSGLRNYIEKYPDGQFAHNAAKTVDIVTWQRAKSEDTLEAYNAYLLEFPNGEAVGLARQKVAMLDK
jgi:hypothetical protein